MKHLNIPRKIFQEPYISDITVSAKWLYVVLKDVEAQRKGNKDYFHISNEELAKAAGMSISALKRAKSQLVSVGLIRTMAIHFLCGEGAAQEKLSKHHVSGYMM